MKSGSREPFVSMSGRSSSWLYLPQPGSISKGYCFWTPSAYIKLKGLIKIWGQLAYVLSKLSATLNWRDSLRYHCQPLRREEPVPQTNSRELDLVNVYCWGGREGYHQSNKASSSSSHWLCSAWYTLQYLVSDILNADSSMIRTVYLLVVGIHVW